MKIQKGQKLKKSTSKQLTKRVLLWLEEYNTDLKAKKKDS